MTPYELNLFLEVYNNISESAVREKLIFVWLGEYYHRIKKLPSLKNALKDFFGESNKKMSDEEMLNMVKKLNAQFGGEVIKDDGIEREES